MKKKRAGKELTEEEEELCKFKRTKQADGDQDAKKKVAKPPPVKKGRGKPKNTQQEVQEEEKEEVHTKELPHSRNHNMNEISDFLMNLEKDRVQREIPKHCGCKFFFV